MATLIDEAKSKFQEAIKNYDIIKELFPNLNDFIHKYVVLSSQLKDDDSLEIKVCTIENERTSIRYPYIHVYLNQKGKKSKFIASYSSGAMFNPPNNLYYNVK